MKQLLFRTFIQTCGRSSSAREPDIWPELIDHTGRPIPSAHRTVIDDIRKRLASNTTPVHLRDFGAGSALSNRETPTVREIYRRATVGDMWGHFLWSVVRALRPVTVVELGTNLGVSASYILSALEANGRRGQLITIEGDPELCELARENLDLIGPGARVIEGRFAEVLPPLLESLSSVDLVFVDGHHDPTALATYFHLLVPHMACDGFLILDDIQPLGPLRSVWRHLRDNPAVTWWFDVWRMGVIWVRTQ